MKSIPFRLMWLILFFCGSAATALASIDDDPLANVGRLDYALLETPTTQLETPPTSGPTTVPAPPPQIAATQPEAASAAEGHFPGIVTTYGLDEFFQHFAPYEPMYFVGGTRAPQIKFQFSLRYRLLTPTGPLATRYPWLRGINFAYSQTSLWDVSDTSHPFFYDSEYRPEVFYYIEDMPGLRLPEACQAGLQFGVGHESNGLRDPDHRSENNAFIRPIITIADSDTHWFVTVEPKFLVYLGELNLNPDLPKYRGYCDMRIVLGKRDGLQLATIGRLGSDYNRGSVQFDLTYPLTKLLNGNTDLSLDADYFYGYGDTILTYNQRSSIFRFGLAFVR
jgi:phospholipase A1/A2